MTRWEPRLRTDDVSELEEMLRAFGGPPYASRWDYVFWNDLFQDIDELISVQLCACVNRPFIGLEVLP